MTFEIKEAKAELAETEMMISALESGVCRSLILSNSEWLADLRAEKAFTEERLGVLENQRP